MTAQVAADLRAAAEVLERDGWTTQCRPDAATGRCLTEAVAAVIPGGRGDMVWDKETDYRFTTATQAMRDHLGGRISQWEEAPARTATEVIAALRAAADAAEVPA